MSAHIRLMPLLMGEVMWIGGEELRSVVTAWYRSHGDDAVGELAARFEYNHERQGWELSFEVYDFDRNQPFNCWRTGTVVLSFDAGGAMSGAHWTHEECEPQPDTLRWRLRPLWLSGLFWHLIPDSIKAQDRDWTDDPFFGAADVTPRRKGE